MSGDPGIRDAVRQLSRAVGTLVRAVVVAARGTRRTAAEHEPESGPPQAWLDMVAETDPDWLARSRWADQGRPADETSVRRFGAVRRAKAAGTGQNERHSLVEEGSPVAERPETTPAPGRNVARTTADLEPARPDNPPAQARRGHGTRPQLRRLLPVDPPDVAGPSADDEPLRRAHPTATGTAEAPTTDDRWDAEARSTRSRPERPTPAQEHLTEIRQDSPTAHTTTAPEFGPAVEPAPLRPYRPSGALPPLPIPTLEDAAGSEQVRTGPVHSRPASTPGPLPALLREPPRLRAPAHEASPAPVPSDRPTAIAAPTWPQLPRTEGLEDAAAHAGPGLAAQLWQADGRPDTLTTAQRRS